MKWNCTARRMSAVVLLLSACERTTVPSTAPTAVRRDDYPTQSDSAARRHADELNQVLAVARTAAIEGDPRLLFELRSTARKGRARGAAVGSEWAPFKPVLSSSELEEDDPNYLNPFQPAVILHKITLISLPRSTRMSVRGTGQVATLMRYFGDQGENRTHASFSGSYNNSIHETQTGLGHPACGWFLCQEWSLGDVYIAPGMPGCGVYANASTYHRAWRQIFKYAPIVGSATWGTDAATSQDFTDNGICSNDSDVTRGYGGRSSNYECHTESSSIDVWNPQTNTWDSIWSGWVTVCGYNDE